jgi:hypothetical protein
MKLYASLFTAFALVVIATPADAAQYGNAAYFDKTLKITERLNDGTMLPRVRKIQTQMINGKLYTNEPAVDKNMSHLRRLSDCSVRPGECKKNTAWEL